MVHLNPHLKLPTLILDGQYKANAQNPGLILQLFCSPLLRLSDTFISMPIIVHEFVDHAVDVRQMEQPTCLDRRSCLYRVLLPPDKLNPKVPPIRTKFELKQVYRDKIGWLFMR